MSEASCWVILEGQNFSASIFDTQDLSTIRGGSLMLRDLVKDAGIWLGRRFPGGVTEATRGGSLGVWRIEAPTHEVASALTDLRADLECHGGEHLGFGLAAIADDGAGFSRQRTRLRAALQRQRLAERRVPYPSLEAVERRVCPVDFIRPVSRGTRQKIGPDKAIDTSAAVYDRRRFGIRKKQELIAEETHDNPALSAEARALIAAGRRPFAMQIASISESADPPADLKASLHDKICVIALDGNGFGKIQDAQLRQEDTVKRQQEFDRSLADLRAGLIARVFSRLVAEGGVGAPCDAERAVRSEVGDAQRDRVARFELLLWGGDEIMFIVPARIGWKILEEVGEAVGEARLCEQPVTFAIGAVFCHHDAPVARIKQLADDLATHLKKLESGEGCERKGRETTLFAIEVLESFDHIGTDLESHLARRLPRPLDSEEFRPGARRAFGALDLGQVKALRTAAEALANGSGGTLSRGRLRQTAFALHQGAAPGAKHRGTNWVRFVEDTQGMLRNEASAPLKGPSSLFTAEAFFVLLEEYWDYLTPIREVEGARVSA